MNSAANAVTISSFVDRHRLIGATVSITHFAGTGMAGAHLRGRTGGVCDCQSPGSAGFDLTVSAGDTFRRSGRSLIRTHRRSFSTRSFSSASI